MSEIPAFPARPARAPGRAHESMTLVPAARAARAHPTTEEQTAMSPRNRVRALTRADMRMEMVAVIAGIGAAVVMAASFAFSYPNIAWVGGALGVNPEWLKWLFPFVIDGPSLVASALAAALHNRYFRERAYAWSVLVIFVSLSWTCNAVHAAAHSTLPQTIGAAEWFGIAVMVLCAGIAPVGVVLGPHMWAYALRKSAAADQRADGTRAERPARTRAAAPADAPRAAPTPHADDPRPAPATAARAEDARPAPAATAVDDAPPPAESDHTREDAYQRYAAQLDSDRIELSGKAIGEAIGMHQGHARKFRNKSWRPRYVAERDGVRLDDRGELVFDDDAAAEHSPTAQADAPDDAAASNGHPDDAGQRVRDLL